jgi:transcriptional regulator with XRE-family HTH domain
MTSRGYHPAMPRTTEAPPAGRLLREWRMRRHLSQLDLAAGAGISTRHLSFIETGRSQPSREMVLHLGEHLEIPLRERNALLTAAGYAPLYRESELDAPDMQPVRDAIDSILRAHEPYPALVVDRTWNLVAANATVQVLMRGIDPSLLEPPINVMRASLHPDGLAPLIVNFDQWSTHLLTRLDRQVLLSGDEDVKALLGELRSYPGVPERATFPELEGAEKVFVPLRLDTGDSSVLTFFSTVTTFGTALDVTLAELSIESFFPADAETARALQPALDEQPTVA